MIKNPQHTKNRRKLAQQSLYEKHKTNISLKEKG